MTIKVTVHSSKDFEKRLDRIAKLYADELTAAMEENAKELYDDSQEIVPVRTGELRKSGRVEKIERKTYAKYLVTYSAEHGLWVHEMDEDTTNWTTPGTGSKFLEKPMRRKKHSFRRRIRKRLRSVSRKSRKTGYGRR